MTTANSPHEYRLNIGLVYAVQACVDRFFEVVKEYGWLGPVEYNPKSPVLTIVRSKQPMPENLRRDLTLLLER